MALYVKRRIQEWYLRPLKSGIYLHTTRRQVQIWSVRRKNEGFLLSLQWTNRRALVMAQQLHLLWWHLHDVNNYGIFVKCTTLLYFTVRPWKRACNNIKFLDYERTIENQLRHLYQSLERRRGLCGLFSHSWERSERFHAEDTKEDFVLHFKQHVSSCMILQNTKRTKFKSSTRAL